MFLRLTLLAIGLGASSLGSTFFKNGDVADMGIGAGLLLIGILCFFFLAKGLWRFLGCLSTFVLMAAFVGVLFFFISGSDIIKNISESVTSVLSDGESNEGEAEQPQQTPPVQPDAVDGVQPKAVNGVTPDGQLPPQQQPQQQQQPQPQPDPVITGKISSIVSGDVFRIGQHTIRLYALAAPLIDQKCQDGNGHLYDCGYVSARMLKDFVSGDDVTCRVMNFNAQNELLAACSVDKTDIGAAMVEEGWALALPNINPIYIPYQQKAQEAQKGLWAGRFQMPWEWMAHKKQAEERAPAKLNIPAPAKKKGKSLFDYL